MIMKTKPRKNQKTRAINVRLTEAERMELKRQAELRGVTPARYVRRLIREALSYGPDFFANEDALLEQLRDDVKNVGRNVNQISRALNTWNKRFVDLKAGMMTIDIPSVLEATDATIKDVGGYIEKIRTDSEQRRLILRRAYSKGK
jgi:predicted DNA-binding protein